MRNICDIFPTTLQKFLAHEHEVGLQYIDSQLNCSHGSMFVCFVFRKKKCGTLSMGNSLRLCLWKLNYSETDLMYFTVLEHCHVNPYEATFMILSIFMTQQTTFCDEKMEMFE